MAGYIERAKAMGFRWVKPNCSHTRKKYFSTGRITLQDYNPWTSKTTRRSVTYFAQPKFQTKVKILFLWLRGTIYNQKREIFTMKGPKRFRFA